MNKKYKVISTTSLLPLKVRLETEDKEELNVNVKVDYPNDKVYFDDYPSNLTDTDLKILEEVILDSFKPPEVDIPQEAFDYYKKAAQVRAGDYATSFMDNVNVKDIFGEN